jgi:thiol-disulfide isomerase/thioredoxin
MKLFKNQWTNIIIAVLILVLVIPATRKPIQIFLNQVLAFSPSVTSESDRTSLANYNWQLEKNNQDQVKFSDYKGKVILINFWATWCPPCIAELPSLQLLYDDYQDNIVFLFVSEEDRVSVNGFLDKKKFSLPVYRPLSPTPLPLDGRTLPTTYLIDKEGNIVISKVGAADWNGEKVRSTIDGLIKK